MNPAVVSNATEEDNTKLAPTSLALAPVVTSSTIGGQEVRKITNISKFKVGDIVEANFSRGNVWYGGKVASVNQSDSSVVLYKIEYEDGDTENDVREADVRFPLDIVKTTELLQLPERTPDSMKTTYQVGDRIQGYFAEYDAWFDGVISEINSDGTYHVKYDDGDEEDRVSSPRLRHFKKRTEIAEASSASSATVPTVSTNLSKVIQSVPQDDKQANTVTGLPAYAIGEKVEGKFGNGSAWYPATVVFVERSKFNPQVFLYKLEYDDGDEEFDVTENLIRRRSESSPVGKSSPQRVNTVPIEVHFQDNASMQRKSSVTTNLDSFLNELSDDDDGGGAGSGLDSGRGVTLSKDGTLTMPPGATDDAYYDDFDA
jgi:hypothetical protein